MIRRNKNILKKILLMLFTIFIGLHESPHILAYTARVPNSRDYNLGTPSSGGGPVSEPTRPYWPYTTCTSNDNLHVYVLEYKNNLSTDRAININAYDQKGRSIVPQTYISKVKFKAGTWLGINIQEYKYASWNVTSTSYSEKVKKYTCANSITAYGTSYNASVLTCKANCPSSCGEQPTCDCNYDDPTEQSACTTACENIATAYSNCINCKTNCGSLIECEGTINNFLPYNLTISNENYCYYGTNYTPSSSATCMYIPSPGLNGEDLISISTPIPQCGVKAVKSTAESALWYVNTPSLQVEIVNPNEYDKNEMKIKKFTNNKLLKDEEEIKTKIPDNVINYLNSITEENYTDYIDMSEPIEYYTTYEYSPDKVCIDVQTSDVGYNTTYNGTNTTECPLNTTDTTKKTIQNTITHDEYLNANLGEDIEYWHYFIPLDTTTTTSNTDDVGFFIRVVNTGDSTLSTEECINALTRYPVEDGEIPQLNYMDFISPVSPTGINATDFSGDYKGITSSSRDMKLFTEYNYKCKFSTKTKFNIEQKFYGEEEKNGILTIKGYGFYYRPINPSRPFPNSIATDSVWLNLYSNEHNENAIVVKKENGTISTTKLNESFDEITYTTSGMSIYDIKNSQNIDKIYTSWRTINNDGTSQFISDYNLRTKSASQYNLYKLGCGPEKIDFLINEAGERFCP